MSEWKIVSSYDESINYRYNIINYLIKKNKYNSYLEIGVAHGETFRSVIAVDKTGVDPNPITPNVTHPITSDEFFSKNTKKFDIVFIDGLHHDCQVDKDITNSLTFLEENGTIVLHDCNPPTKNHGMDEWILADWNGTVWKSIVKQRCTNKNVTINVVDIDWGCGILKKGLQEIYTKDSLEQCLTWEYFETHKKELLNLISAEEFKKLY